MSPFYRKFYHLRHSLYTISTKSQKSTISFLFGNNFMDNIALWILIIVVIIIGFDCVCGSEAINASRGGNGQKREGFDDTATQQPVIPANMTGFEGGFHCNVGNELVPVSGNGSGLFHVIVDANNKPMKFATKTDCETWTTSPQATFKANSCKNDGTGICTDFYNAVGLAQPESQNSIPISTADTSPTVINNTTTVAPDFTWLGWCLYCICCASPICICLISCSCGAAIFGNKKGKE